MRDLLQIPIRILVNRIPPLLVAGIFISVWQGLSMLVYSEFLLPSPSATLGAIFELLINGILINHLLTSLSRVFIGFTLAASLAIPFGLILGWYGRAMNAFNPLIQILRPISPIAWIPLAILWFGIGDRPAIFIIFITSFFPVLITSASAVRNIDASIIKAAVNFGARGTGMLKKVVLPACFPQIVVGLRISLGIAWVIIVAAEMVGMRSGLGFMILDARNFLRIDMVVAGMVIIGLVGLGLDRLVCSIENKIRRRYGFSGV
ncbi:MAG: ABC transporter permease [Candidatus Methanoperedens sp.]|nr:ABC transporter permease [Candidatus Methanoperedens sp.]